MDNKKYVLYIGEMVMPDGNAASQRVISVCKSLVDLGYTPVVIGLDHNAKGNDILSSLKIYNNMDCYAVKYPSKKTEWLYRIWTIKPIKKVIARYGIENIKAIIAIDFESIPLLKLKRFCDKNDIKMIGDNVEWYEKSQLSFPFNIAKDLDTNIRMKYIYPKFENMICISKYLFDIYNSKCKNTVLIPGTIDENESKWKENVEYIPNKTFTFVYAGFPGPHFSKERLDLAIRIICELNKENVKCILKIIGVDNSLIEKYAKELLLLDNYYECIYCLGKKTHEQCLLEISGAEMSIILREDRLVTKAGFPTKLSESFGCGTPVVSTPSSNISDFIINGKNGFVTDDFSYENVKNTIKNIVTYANIDEMKNFTKSNNPLTYDKFTHLLGRIIGDKKP